jgi:streptomycin 6-kinase
MREWAQALPAAVETAAKRWHLHVEPPFEPGGSASWVAPVRTADGRPAVLKVRWRHFEADHEVQGLRAWAGRGAVLLVDELALGDLAIDAQTDALLLERCSPGISAQTLPEDEQDHVVAATLRRLWIPAPPQPFRPLSTMCDAWADSLDESRAAAAIGDYGIVRTGVDLFRTLPREHPEPDVLLATDLHAGNVLAAERERWLAIDPKPYVGDRTYDALQHMLNCPRRLQDDPVGFGASIAALLDLDKERLLRWLFARCVVESAEWPELARVARLTAPR